MFPALLMPRTPHRGRFPLPEALEAGGDVFDASDALSRIHFRWVNLD
jgi:hypothetical protein